MVEASIIIPAYNEEEYIGKLINSLQKQTYKNFEIIVVDDGSRDKTREIVRKFKKVNLIEGQHKGPGFSRNLAAKIAKGKFLVFVDSDMTFDKNYLKNLILPIKENNEIIGTTHDFEIATNTNNVYSRLWGKIRVSKKNAENVKIFRAIRKDYFLRLGGFDTKYGYADDQTFWFKFKIKPSVAKDTICYHCNPESLEETYNQARWIGMSWKTRFRILSIPLINIIILFILVLLLLPYSFIRSVKVKMENRDIKFILIYLFYFYKFRGYLSGLLKSILFDELIK